MSTPIIVCPTDCLGEVPPINQDECNPIVDISEVSKLYMTNIDNPMADWTSLAEWTTRIDNSGTDVDDIREWWVSGELPEPDRNITEIDNDREVASPSDYELGLEVFDLGDDEITYDALRLLQCNQRKLIWYAAGNYLYGGTTGIESDVIADYIITKGSKEINMGTMKVKWETKFSAERITNPML
jgi:hypothetical protein